MFIPREPPYLRLQTPLCCLINPKWVCRRCYGLICTECNNKDIAYEDRHGSDVGWMGHIEEGCLDLDCERANECWTSF